MSRPLALNHLEVDYLEQAQITVNIFGMDDARLDAIDREVVTYLMKHVMKSTITNCVSEILNQYDNPQEKVYAAYSVGMLIGHMKGRVSE